MSVLTITEAKARKLDEVEDLALDIITKALNATIAADSPEVKVASNTLSMVSKNRQTTTHDKGIGFAMASAVLTDEQLKAYTQVSSPEIKKAITGKHS